MVSLSVDGTVVARLIPGVRYFHFRKGLSYPVLMIMIPEISVRSALHNTDLVTL